MSRRRGAGSRLQAPDFRLTTLPFSWSLEPGIWSLVPGACSSFLRITGGFVMLRAHWSAAFGRSRTSHALTHKEIHYMCMRIVYLLGVAAALTTHVTTAA